MYDTERERERECVCVCVCVRDGQLIMKNRDAVFDSNNGIIIICLSIFENCNNHVKLLDISTSNHEIFINLYKSRPVTIVYWGLQCIANSHDYRDLIINVEKFQYP